MLARRENVYTPGVIKEIQINRHIGVLQDEDKQTVYYRDVIETRYVHWVPVITSNLIHKNLLVISGARYKWYSL